MKKKLTKLEKFWILYDVGNSAFVLMVSTILPIYFNALGEAGGLSSTEYLAYWGYAASVSTLAVAVLGPVLGTMADRKGLKTGFFGFRTNHASYPGYVSRRYFSRISYAPFSRAYRKSVSIYFS